MNLLHLKYAIAISETNSMTKAAEKLYTAQPNLSRAMRDLESSLGITIFKRTSKGIYPTDEGEEFLSRARKILAEVDDLEAKYRDRQGRAMRFSVSVPRASYIACAFTAFIDKLDPELSAEIYYKETNALRAISNLQNADYKLGIIRYQATYEKNFRDMLKEKELCSELLYEFNYRLLMSEKHPLAACDNVRLCDLSPYIEIAHPDPFVPSLPMPTVLKNELIDDTDKIIYVFERGSQMDLLSQNPLTFMWVSPIPQRILDRYGLTERSCAENTRKYRDVLIYKKDYRLSNLDHAFLDEIVKIRAVLP
ncbi:MAG: LysR family transcriptional regulator [Clostridia bacterium]|nr:LysR family transcriptional regulator [Clostridia bacterium]